MHSNLILPRSVRRALAGNLELPRAIVRRFTEDGLMTYDAATIDSAGAFLVNELERLDPTLNNPLVEFTWQRDVNVRTDVTMGDELASWTNSSLASAGGPSPNGKSWVGKDGNVIPQIQLDIGKTAQGLYLWAEQASWTLPELASAMQTGRPIDSQKLEGVNLKHEMDIDEQVYIGDGPLGLTGLINNASVTPVAAVTGGWATATPDQILADVNATLYRSYLASSFAAVPSKLLLPPLQFSYLASTKVSTAGNETILGFVRRNSLANAKNGRELDIQPVKWLTNAGASNSQRMVAYTNNPKFVRFPLVPLQRTPLEYRGLQQLTTYFGRIGVVEVRYPSTFAYTDGI